MLDPRPLSGDSGDTSSSTGQEVFPNLNRPYNWTAPQPGNFAVRPAGSSLGLAAGAAAASGSLAAYDNATFGLGAGVAFKSSSDTMRPVRFNPPLAHKMRPNQKSPYAPWYESGDLGLERKSTDSWRLGQLVGSDEILDAYQDTVDFRAGFRFLYNPTTISSSASINSAVSPDALKDGSMGLLITAGGLGTITFEILLNRIAEVTGELNRDPTDDQKDLQARGTMVDLDYLFRVANGTWEVTLGYGPPSVSVPDDKDKDNPDKNRRKGDRHNLPAAGEKPDTSQTTFVSQTGDIGMLIPTPMWLTLGPGLRYYGWLKAVSHKHTMFSEHMVPMVTRVSIEFQRLNKGTKADFDKINESASQYGVINGDVFAPPPKTSSVADPEGPGGGVGQYPASPKEKAYFSQDLPGPREAYQNVVASFRALEAVFPKVSTIGSYRPSNPYPDHPSGLALDIMTNTPGVGTDMGNDIAKFFMDQHRRFGIRYMIWQQRIWNAETESPKPLNEWRGMSDRGSPTANHMDHIHLCHFPYPNDRNWNGPGWKIVKGSYWDDGASASVDGMPPLSGSPKEIIDGIVLYSHKIGFKGLTIRHVEKANAAHSELTSAGYRSDHKGPPEQAWACDWGDSWSGQDACTKLAQAIADAYSIGKWDGSGLTNHNKNGYRLQLIWKAEGHFDHVHLGIKKISSTRRSPTDRTGT